MASGKSPRGSQKPEERLASCTCFNLRKAARVVTQVYDEALQSSGLRGTQFTLLAVLDQMQSPAVSELARVMVMDRTTLSRNLRPLEKKGWIKSLPGADRRIRELTLTASGRKMLARAMPLWKKAQKDLVDRLGKQRWRGLLDHLDFTVRHVGAD
jgi:DNA-binding MarR family transcriptional regulator